MKVVRTRVVATAAVREASNGAGFLAQVRRLGFDPQILSGEEEGKRAGQGVLSAIPDADGIVGDLGGGSLELVEVSGGKVGRRASLPLGVFRLDALIEGGGSFSKAIARAVADAGFEGVAGERPLYLVGGSWRTLARLDMEVFDHPLPITHQHVMPAGRPRELRDILTKVSKADVRDIPSISVSRVPTLPNANRLLEALVRALEPSHLVVSSFGIREGLLYDELPPGQRALDPLIEAAREAGAGLGRFVQHGDLLDAWIARAFDDPPQMARLQARRLPARRHRLGRASRFPARARHRHGAARQLGGDRRAGPGDARPGPVLQFRRRPRAALSRHRGALQRGAAEARRGLGFRHAARPAAQRRRRRRPQEQPPGPRRRRAPPRNRKGNAALLGETVERRLKTLAGELALRPEIA